MLQCFVNALNGKLVLFGPVHASLTLLHSIFTDPAGLEDSL